MTISQFYPWKDPRVEGTLSIYESNINSLWALEVESVPRKYTLVNVETGQRVCLCQDISNANLFTALDVAQEVLASGYYG